MHVSDRMIHQYRKKTLIEAIQFNGENGNEIAEWANSPETLDRKCILTVHWDFNTLPPEQHLFCKTAAGFEQRIDKGGWVLKNTTHEIYPCRPDIFEQTYERMNE
jgi:hypothetical protein